MKTLVVTNQKGGVGKTAMVVHLAFHLVQRCNKKVAVLDLDTQANASLTLGDMAVAGGAASGLFKDGFTVANSITSPGVLLISADEALADMEKVALGTAAAAFRKSLEAIAQSGVEVCLIDTAPSLGNAMASALTSATHVVSPVEPTSYSMQGLKKMLTVIGNIRRINPALKFLGMLPNRVNSRSKKHKATLAILRQHYSELVMPMEVPQRESIQNAIDERLPVWALKDNAQARKTGAELTTTLDYIVDRMECK